MLGLIDQLVNSTANAVQNAMWNALTNSLSGLLKSSYGLFILGIALIVLGGLGKAFGTPMIWVGVAIILVSILLILGIA